MFSAKVHLCARNNYEKRKRKKKKKTHTQKHTFSERSSDTHPNGVGSPLQSGFCGRHHFFRLQREQQTAVTGKITSAARTVALIEPFVVDWAQSRTIALIEPFVVDWAHSRTIAPIEPFVVDWAQSTN